MGLTPSPDKCPGKRELSGTMLGICIGCQRKDERSTATPPAVRMDSGRWRCDALVPPAGWPKP